MFGVVCNRNLCGFELLIDWIEWVFWSLVGFGV